MDRLTPEKRSWNMSRIKSKDTTPERFVRSFLHRNGFRFRLHVKDLPGKPDIVLPKYKLIIDIRGCFWHCHRNCDQYRLPSANQEWWKNKLDENVLRDTKNCNDWSAKGWNVLVIWSCLFKHMNKQNGDIILNYVATYLKEIICKKQVCLELSWNDFCIRKDSLYA